MLTSFTFKYSVRTAQ